MFTTILPIDPHPTLNDFTQIKILNTTMTVNADKDYILLDSYTSMGCNMFMDFQLKNEK